jgi:hypothetical protein
VLVLGVAAVGLGLRLWILHSRLGGLDSDEAVTGLMARRLLHGHTNAFFLGQAYGGTQEAALVALVYFVVRSWTVAMKVVPVVLWATAGVLVWRIGRRMFGEDAGRVAGLLFWVGPAATLWLSIKEQAFYGFTMVMGLTLLLFAVRLVERPAPLDAVAAGLAAGMGWWANPQIAYFALPALVWMVLRRPGLVRLAWLAVGGALVGALPWLYANVGRGFPSLHSPPQGVASTYPHRLRLFAETGLPVLVGLRRMWTTRWLVPGLAPALYIGVLLALVAAGVALVRTVMRGGSDDGRGLLLLACVCYPFVFAISSFAFYVFDARYLVFLWPFLVMLAAPFLVPRAAQVAAIAVVAALGVTGVALALGEADLDPVAPNAAAHPIGPVLRVLDERGVTQVFADYWAAYRIDLATGERLSATPFAGSTRDFALMARVRSSPRPGYVILDGSPSDEALGASLRARAIPYQRVAAGDYVVYLPEAAVMPESVAGL